MADEFSEFIEISDVDGDFACKKNMFLNFNITFLSIYIIICLLLVVLNLK